MILVVCWRPRSISSTLYLTILNLVALLVIRYPLYLPYINCIIYSIGFSWLWFLLIGYLISYRTYCYWCVLGLGMEGNWYFSFKDTIFYSWFKLLLRWFNAYLIVSKWLLRSYLSILLTRMNYSFVLGIVGLNFMGLSKCCDGFVHIFYLYLFVFSMLSVRWLVYGW